MRSQGSASFLIRSKDTFLLVFFLFLVAALESLGLQSGLLLLLAELISEDSKFSKPGQPVVCSLTHVANREQRSGAAPNLGTKRRVGAAEQKAKQPKRSGRGMSASALFAGGLCHPLTWSHRTPCRPYHQSELSHKRL